MTKREVLKEISAKSGVPISLVNEVLTELGNLVVNLKVGDSVYTPFGSFRSKYHPSRESVTPAGKFKSPERVLIRWKSKYCKIVEADKRWNYIMGKDEVETQPVPQVVETVIAAPSPIQTMVEASVAQKPEAPKKTRAKK